MKTNNTSLKPRILVIDDNRAIHEDFRKIFGGLDADDSLDAVESNLFDDAPTASPANTILQTLLQAINAHQVGRPVSDDVTLLVIRRQPEQALASEVLSFVLPRELSYLKTLDTTLQEAMGHLPNNSAVENWRHEFGLAVVEHASNIIRHAYAHKPAGNVYGHLPAPLNN